LALARFFAGAGDQAAAIDFQAQAISTLRAQAANDEAQQTLSVALFNQAGYLARADRLGEAVAAMEEVVAIDRQLGLADLASDQAVLAQMQRQQAGLPPEPTEAAEPDLLAAFVAYIETLSPKDQPAARQALAQLQALSPAEQAAAMQAMQQQAIMAQAEQIAAAARQARQAGQVAALLPQLQQVAAQFGEDEEAGSAYDQLAQFVLAVVALLEKQPVPAVAPAYAALLAALQQDLSAV
jgi:hypothetical protein